MPDVEAVPCSVPFRASLRRASERRSAIARGRRARLRGRAGIAVLVAAMTLVTGAATAADGGARAKGSAATAASVTLKRGSTGPAVEALQRRLRLRADGAFGPRTERAVKRFQRRRGLVADGIVGPATAKALGLRVAHESSRRLASVDPALARIAECESGGNPAAVSADGRYRGKYQFSMATWQALGGAGDPAKAPESEQDRLAAALYAQHGTSPWPNCA